MTRFVDGNGIEKKYENLTVTEEERKQVFRLWRRDAPYYTFNAQRIDLVR